jgi:hypothetical protein
MERTASQAAAFQVDEETSSERGTAMDLVRFLECGAIDAALPLS